MVRILKFKVNPNSVTSIDVPVGSKPLSVAFQGIKLYAWVEVPMNEHLPKVPLHFIAQETGRPYSEDSRNTFLGTAMFGYENGRGLNQYVAHVFYHIRKG